MAEEFSERYRLMIEAARMGLGPKRASVEFYERMLPERILKNLKIEFQGDSRFSDRKYLENLMRLYNENVCEACLNANLKPPVL